MARRVEIEPGAADDVRQITGFISRRVSPQSAAHWHRKLYSTVLRLADDAEQWGEADEAGELGINLRCRLFGRRPHVYRILFTLDATTVSVLAVRHAAQERLTADDL